MSTTTTTITITITTTNKIDVNEKLSPERNALCESVLINWTRSRELHNCTMSRV